MFSGLLDEFFWKDQVELPHFGHSCRELRFTPEVLGEKSQRAKIRTMQVLFTPICAMRVAGQQRFTYLPSLAIQRLGINPPSASRKTRYAAHNCMILHVYIYISIFIYILRQLEVTFGIFLFVHFFGREKSKVEKLLLFYFSSFLPLAFLKKIEQ